MLINFVITIFFLYLCIYNKIHNEINIIYGKNNIIVYRLYNVLDRHNSTYEQNIHKGYYILFLLILWRNHYSNLFFNLKIFQYIYILK